MNGATRWCKTVARVGTRFEDGYCMSAEQMQELQAKAAEDREHFRRNQTICGSGICGDDG